MRRWLCLLLASSVLAACAQKPAAPAAEAALPSTPSGAAAPPQAAKAAFTPCKFETLGNHNFHAGEDVQFVFTVKSGSQWCFDGFAVGGTSTEGQAITDRPSHGTLRLVSQPGAVVIGYRPAPGYSGRDRFRVSVPATFDTAYFVGNVTIEP